MKIISWNVNGIRAIIKKEFFETVHNLDPDILCIQETKAQDSEVEKALLPLKNYHLYSNSAEKKGYSGVATFSKREPDQIIMGCGIEKYDREGRILRTDFGDWSLLNCYFPSGTSGEERQAFKMEYLNDFFKWIEELRKERPKLIIVGDYNIAHTENDIHNPKGNKKNSGFLPEEREWMTQWFANGFVDAYRHLNPEEVQYSWWSYRANARANNKGWRIDYQSVSENLKSSLKEAYHMKDAMQSDHCPVFVKFGF